MKKQSILEKLDTYFDNKSQNESQIMFLGVFAIIAFVGYMVVFPISQEYFDQKESAFNNISKNLNDTNNYLKSVSGPDGGDREYKIKEFQANLQNQIDQLNLLKSYNGYFEGKLRDVSELTYSEKNWAKFLDDLTLLADENSIKISLLQSERKEPDLKKIEEVLNINLKLEGSFSDILKYINYIEESEMVVDINHLDINSTGKNLGGSMNIAVWGMKYQ